MNKWIRRNAIISAVAMVILAVLLATTASLAWYSTQLSNDMKIVISADGMVVLDFESEIYVTPIGEGLTPAVETIDAIANNIDTSDVLTVNEGIAVPATKVTYDCQLGVYLPEQNPPPQNLYFGLTAIITTKDGLEYRLTQYQLTEIFGMQLQMSTKLEFVWDENDQEYPPTPYVDVPLAQNFPAVGQTPDASINSFQVTASSTLYLRLTLWLNHPQGLMDPILNESSVHFLLSVAARTVIS